MSCLIYDHPNHPQDIDDLPFHARLQSGQITGLINRWTGYDQENSTTNNLMLLIIRLLIQSELGLASMGHA